jgi:hypothetical protein
MINKRPRYRTLGIVGAAFATVILTACGSAARPSTVAAPAVAATASATAGPAPEQNVPSPTPVETTPSEPAVCTTVDCEAYFRRVVQWNGPGGVTAATVDNVLKAAFMACQKMSEGTAARDIADQLLRYGVADSDQVLLMFAAATDKGSLCPQFKQEIAGLR